MSNNRTVKKNKSSKIEHKVFKITLNGDISIEFSLGTLFATKEVL